MNTFLQFLILDWN